MLRQRDDYLSPSLEDLLLQIGKMKNQSNGHHLDEMAVQCFSVLNENAHTEVFYLSDHDFNTV